MLFTHTTTIPINSNLSDTSESLAKHVITLDFRLQQLESKGVVLYPAPSFFKPTPQTNNSQLDFIPKRKVRPCFQFDDWLLRTWHAVNVSAGAPISSLMDSCVLSARKIRLTLRLHQIRRAVNGRNKPQHVLLNHKTQHHCKEFDNEKLMFLEKEAEQKKDNWWKSKSRKIFRDTILISFLYVSCITMTRKFKWQNCHEVVVCLCSLNPCIEIWHVFDTHGCPSASQTCST